MASQYWSLGGENVLPIRHAIVIAMVPFRVVEVQGVKAPPTPTTDGTYP